MKKLDRLVKDVYRESLRHVIVEVDRSGGRFFVLTDLPKDVTDDQMNQLFDISFTKSVREWLQGNPPYWSRTHYVHTKHSMTMLGIQARIRRELIGTRNNYDYGDIVTTWPAAVKWLEIQYTKEMSRYKGDFCE